jgi:hypothetical protein
MKKYSESIGKFGPSPFLVTMYGGGAELSQAFCRVCAVYGGVYRLNCCITRVGWGKTSNLWEVELDDGTTFTCNRLITNPCFAHKFELPIPLNFEDRSDPSRAYQAIVISSESIQSDILAALFTIPPEQLGTGFGSSVQMIQISSELKMCPPGRFLMHFRGESRAAIEAAISLTINQKRTANYLFKINLCFVSNQAVPTLLFNLFIIFGVDVKHITHYEHAASLNSPEPSSEFPEMPIIVPWTNVGLDMDEDLGNTLEVWHYHFEADFAFEPLPDPEVASMVQEEMVENLEESAPVLN